MNRAIFLLIVFALQPVFAQETVDDNGKKVEMNFEDELVKGETIKPDSTFLSSGKVFNYKKLIRLRENFIPEVQKGRGEFSDK